MGDSRDIAKPGWVDGSVWPYIIAEAGVNHNGRVELALKLVDAAKEVGADCVKFQAFSAEELVVKGAEKAGYQKLCGKEGESQYEMLLRCELKEGEFRQIKERCDKCEIDFLVTPFSARWVEILSAMGVSAFKVGSGNIGAVKLLEAIGQTKQPIIVSTGMSDMEDVDKTIQVLRESGCGELAVLQCVSQYPTDKRDVNLDVMISTLRKRLKITVGFSDHTKEIISGAVAVAVGASILEKHFTLDKKMNGPDHKMSLKQEQLRKYIDYARTAAILCGNWQKKVSAEELKMKEAARMSIVVSSDIKAGTEITPDMISSGMFTVKRPGIGIPADQLKNIIGTSTTCDLHRDHILKPSDLKNTGFENTGF